MRTSILRFDSIDSTNAEAARQARRGAPEGLCVVAREQTRGRGRQDRVWISPKDAGLYFSIVLRPRLEMSAWPLISLMAALSVSDALRNACDLHTDLKWPNDICVDNRKLCGILTEAVEAAEGFAAIVGIGINLSGEALPDELRDVATSVESATGNRPSSEIVLQALVPAIEDYYSVLQGTDGDKKTIREWRARSSYAQGKRVRVSASNETFEGVTRGLESDGALRVETDAGEIRVVRAGDVTALRKG